MQRAGTRAARANSRNVWVQLLMIVPTGLVLGLVAFGRYGHRHVEPTPRKALMLLMAAFLIGPVAVSILGLLAWMLLVALVVALLAMAAALRRPRTPLRS